MNLKPLASKLKKAAPIILSALSVIGVVGTAILSAKATAKALEQVDERDDTWKCYIPTALVALATTMCIIGNGVLNRKTQASLLAAYAVLDRSYRQYRGKAKELFGEDADKKIRSSISVEQASPEIPEYDPKIFNAYDLDWGVDEQEKQHVFYEVVGQKMFVSTINRVRQAEQMLAHDVSEGAFKSVNDFYAYLGLEPVDGCDIIGWCVSDGYLNIEFMHYIGEMDDGIAGKTECLVIDYYNLPDTEKMLGLC